MKIKFSKLDDALFQDEHLNKDALGMVLAGGLKGNATVTMGTDTTYNSNNEAVDEETWEDAD